MQFARSGMEYLEKMLSRFLKSVLVVHLMKTSKAQLLLSLLRLVVAWTELRLI
jgi:hypothetical protein